MTSKKIWFITGASRGMGRGIALAFRSGGAQVIAVARDSQRLAELACERMLLSSCQIPNHRSRLTIENGIPTALHGSLPPTCDVCSKCKSGKQDHGQQY